MTYTQPPPQATANETPKARAKIGYFSKNLPLSPLAQFFGVFFRVSAWRCIAAGPPTRSRNTRDAAASIMMILWHPPFPQRSSVMARPRAIAGFSLILAAVVALAGPSVTAGGKLDPVKVQASAGKPDDSGKQTVSVQLTIDKGWHG